MPKFKKDDKGPPSFSEYYTIRRRDKDGKAMSIRCNLCNKFCKISNWEDLNCSNCRKEI